jgi:uroporphyrinogen decarboxylase
VFSEKDAEARIPIPTPEEVLASGVFDYTEAYVRAYGKEQFVTAAVVNAFYSAGWHVGQANRFTLLHDEPDLMHYVMDRITRQNIANIQAMGRVGCDAVLIDDATATKDMISPKMYREFSLPYIKRLVEAIKNLGMKAVLVYFGGISDRVEDILSAGADALQMEASMKNYVNDLEAIAAQVNGRTLLFGNLNPREDIELATDDELVARIAAQTAIGKKYGRFVVSAGSPLTPTTTLERVQRFIELGHTLSAC